MCVQTSGLSEVLSTYFVGKMEEKLEIFKRELRLKI